jgi:hypothetical protein
MSSDGTKIVATADTTSSPNVQGGYWTSSDCGEHWQAYLELNESSWGKVACSSDGTKIVSWHGFDLWTSTDFGRHVQYQNGLGGWTWTSVACSSDGTKIVACDGNGCVWVGQ